MSKFNFKRVIDNIVQVKREVPIVLMNTAQNYFLKAFKDQGYNGQSWTEVQRRIPDTQEYRYPKTKGLARRTKPILIMTGKLRREVSLLSSKARVSYSKYDFKVQMEIDSSVVPYADYLNKGTEKMVKRQFMGNTPELRRILRAKLKSYFDKAIFVK